MIKTPVNGSNSDPWNHLWCLFWCWWASSVLSGAYSAVPPPASIQKAPTAPAAASKAKDSDSSDSSDDSSDEDEKKKKVARKWLPSFSPWPPGHFSLMSNSILTLTAKSTPAKTPAAKPAASKPAAKKQESSSESSGNGYKNPLLFPILKKWVCDGECLLMSISF